MAGMTKNTPPWARLMRPTLSARRLRARLVRLAAALCVALAVFATLSVYSSMTATASITVASRAIARGSVITRKDVTVIEVPASIAVEGATRSVDDVVGSIAQIDIDEHQPFHPTLTRTAPVIPPGRSAIEVHVSNDVADLLPGDTISLVSAVGCTTRNDIIPEPSANADDGTADPTDPDGTGGPAAGSETVEQRQGPCTLTNQALVMRPASVDDSGDTTIEVAVEPDAAVRVMASADAGAIVAVEQ
ncbi:hypothetical protein CSQ85_10035 [Bifidobacterium rousetti]|nr:hypothetical protein CSQ85_10035 [Bifidobacterium rousetti]